MVFHFNGDCIGNNNFKEFIMKIYIGPYKDWFGPYQLADLLQKVGVSEERCSSIGDWLSETWVNKVLTWIHKERERKVCVTLHPYDTWSMDSTLAIIILPMLKQLQRTKHGAPLVHDDDVPEHLRSTNASPKENEYDIDDNHFKRWDWVLDEMIWGFEQLQPDYDYMEQYMSGESNWEFKPIEGKNGLTEIVHGPNHTLQIDSEGLKAHEARINNSLRLFGKYYRNLWD